MQDRIMISSDKIQAIAAAINEKTGNNAGMTLEEMADAIKNLNIAKNEEENIHNLFYQGKIKVLIPDIEIHETLCINIESVTPFN